MSLDQTEPLALLALLDIERVSQISSVNEGFGDTRLWRVEHDGRVSILRVYPKQLRHVRDRALAFMRAIKSVPIPRIEAVGEPKGLPTMLLSWCDGTTLLAALTATAGDARTLGVLFGRTQARIHANPIPAGLREQSLRSWIDWGTTEASPLVQTLRQMPILRESVLHLDYHPLNVMVVHGALSGVIDWTNALIGDVRADFARTYSMLHWLPLPTLPNAEHGRRVLQQFRRGWADGYRETSGSLPNLAPFLAWAALLLERDLEPKIGSKGFWITANDLQQMHQAHVRWSRRAGLLPEEGPV